MNLTLHFLIDSNNNGDVPVTPTRMVQEDLQKQGGGLQLMSHPKSVALNNIRKRSYL